MWERRYDWSDCLETTALVRGAGGGFFVGRSQSYGSGAVVRLDAAGDVDWSEDLANRSGGNVLGLAPRPGGGCVAAGSWSSDGAHYYLATFTAAGFGQDYAPADFSADQEYRAVVALDDTTFVAAGYERSFSSNAGASAVLAKFTQGRAITNRWERVFSGNYDQQATSLLALPGGDFLVVGYADTLGTGVNDVYAVRTDAQGVPRWARRFGTADLDEVGFAVCATPDGNFVAAGSQAVQRGAGDVFVVKFDGSGRSSGGGPWGAPPTTWRGPSCPTGTACC